MLLLLAKSLISGTGKYWLIGGAIVAAIAYVMILQTTVSGLRADLTAAKSDLTEASRVNAANKQALSDLAGEYTNALAALRDRTEQAADLAKTIATLKAEAKHVTYSPTDCTTVGPAVRHVLGGLRDLHPLVADGNQNPTGDTARRSVDLPAGPAAAGH